MKKQTGEDAPKTGAINVNEAKEADEERKRGGRRKFGGKVHGEKSEDRPDRRARGGSVGADMHPMTAAGSMSAMDYEGGKPGTTEAGGKGGDKNTKGKG